MPGEEVRRAVTVRPRSPTRPDRRRFAEPPDAPRMTPGRFVTLRMLAVSAVLAQFLLGTALGAVRLQPSMRSLGLPLPAVGVSIVGTARPRDPTQEAWPAADGAVDLRGRPGPSWSRWGGWAIGR